MSDLPALKGEYRRIKFFACPAELQGEGEVPKGTRIGEIECEQCGGGAMSYVCVGDGQHVYAYHNGHHPRAVPDHINVQCGVTVIKTNRPQGRLVIRHWREKKEKTDAPKSKPAPTIKATKPAAAVKPAAAAGKPAAKPGPAAQRDDTAPAGTERGGRWPWG